MELNGIDEISNPGCLPTVMDVLTEGGKLLVEAWDVWHGKIVGQHEFMSRGI